MTELRSIMLKIIEIYDFTAWPKWHRQKGKGESPLKYRAFYYPLGKKVVRHEFFSSAKRASRSKMSSVYRYSPCFDLRRLIDGEYLPSRHRRVPIDVGIFFFKKKKMPRLKPRHKKFFIKKIFYKNFYYIEILFL